jgi:hypothetical protein
LHIISDNWVILCKSKFHSNYEIFQIFHANWKLYSNTLIKKLKF